ncbi:MAG: hypothetical protein ABI554_04670, partial [Flavobacterium sp.]
VFLENDFKNSVFIGFNSGVEFNVLSYFKPELEVSYFVGAIEDIERRDNAGNINEIIGRNAYSLNFSIIPKIDLGSRSTNTEVGMAHFQILPKYTISRIEGKGSYTIINSNNYSKSVTESDVVTEWKHSVGIGIGLHVPVSQNNNNSISLNLYYNGIDLGDAINKLKYKKSYEINTKGALGLGINYFFGFKHKKS